MRKLVLIVTGALIIVCALAPFQSSAIVDEAQGDPVATQESTNVVEGNKLLTKTTGRPPQVEFVPGEILVKFTDAVNVANLVAGQKTSKGLLQSASSVQLTNIFEKFGVHDADTPFAFSESSPLRNVVKLTAASMKFDREKTRELVLELRGQPEVEYAELNLIMRAQIVPNDPYYSSSGAWGQTFRDLWGLQNISAETAWNTSTGQSVIVAVSDTGVDYNHEDIAANMVSGKNFVTGAPNSNDPMDDQGHGSHVAGTIAAVGNNSKGTIGVAYGAKIMPVKGLNQFGSGSTDDLVKTILYAADNGAKVINASWGGFSNEPVQTLIDAVNYAHDVRGVVIVAAAGNNNGDVGMQQSGFSPANIRNVITVAAFDHTDTKAFFSNFGQKIDVAAPGGGDTDATNTIFSPHYSVLSLLSGGLSSDARDAMTSSGKLIVGGKYLRIAGTSMAAPHVAGVVALIRSQHPEYSPEQVRQALRLGGDDVSTPGFDTNSGYGRINAAKSLAVVAPLVAQLTAPVTTVSSIDSCNVAIRGTAAGTAFSSWRLEFGSGTNPTTWTQIATSASQVTNGVLTNWNTGSLADGTYTIHLIAQNTENKLFEDRLVVKIDNVFITDPSVSGSFFSDPVVRGDKPIVIKGTAAGCTFSSYTIKIKRAKDGQFLTNPSITLPNGGMQKVSNGTLATWDASNLPADRYQVILEVQQSGASPIQRSIRVIVDSTIHPGWPKNVGLIGGGGFSLAITDHLDLADVDGDGAKDILVGYGVEVRIYGHNGDLLAGWPQTVDPQSKDAVIQNSPAVGDLDGDGKPEIVATNNDNQVFIWHANGTLLSGWPKNIGGGINSLSIDDVNNDQMPEVIASDRWGRVNVFDKNGQSLPGWPRSLAGNVSSILSPACIGDVDGDGRKEIVAKDLINGYLYVLRADGTAMSGWPKAVSTKFNFTYPALGDLNGDGRLEMVVPSDDGKVYAFNADGTNAPGWPQSTSATVLNSPAIGDIDGDGKAEVVVGGYQGGGTGRADYAYAWHGDGTLFPDWPVTNDGSSSNGFGAIVLSDVDGDGKADVLVTANRGASSDALVGPAAVKAFRYDGATVAGFPKQTVVSGPFDSDTVAIADLDNDGLLEMAWIDGNANLYVWDLQPPTLANSPWPMFHHDAQHTGRNPLSLGPVVPSSGCPSITSLSTLVTSVSDTVTITGSGFANSTSVKFSNNLTASFNVFNDTQITTVVPSGAIGGPITISKTGCTDRQTQSLTVCSNPPATLSIDSGTANTSWSAGSYYVNRLTPASYPATLSQISIYFASFSKLPIGSPITVLAGANTGGGANMNNISLQSFAGTVGKVDQFNTYALPNPIKINSGDFVIGFMVASGNDVFPGATSNNTSAGRSYISGDGATFSIFNFFNNGLGNFMIRGQVVTGPCSAPPTVNVTVQTNPSGRTFTVDGTDYSAAKTFSWTPGSSHSISTTSPQSGAAGIQYVWSNWSDNDAISHTVSPTSGTTYTANFTTQYFLTMNVGAGGSVNPPSGYFNSGQIVNISAASNIGFAFSSWSGSGSGSLTGTSNPVNITINGPITETANFVPAPVIFLEQGTNNAAVLNSVTFARGPFRLFDAFNFSADKRTRIMLFTSDLGLSQPNPSILTVQAAGFSFPVENVGTFVGVSGLNGSYIIARLPDGLPTGALQLTITLRGVTSNVTALQIAP